MTYTLDIDAIVNATPASLWQAWTDVARFTTWDAREEEARIEGPFAVGTNLWSKQRGAPGGVLTLIEVVPERLWRAQKRLPGGALVVDHRIEPLDDGRVRVSKRYEARGPMAFMFRWFFSRGIRRTVPESFAALEREAQRIAGS